MIRTSINLLKNGILRTSATLFSPRYLLFTNTSIGFLAGGTGDLMYQNMDIYRGRKNEWSWYRTRNQCAQGTVFGFIYHFWYILLDRKFPAVTTACVFKKLAVDQLVMSPAMVVIYLGLLNFLEGGTPQDGFKSIKDKGKKLLLVEWTFGPTSQLVNFYLIPSRFRVLYDSIVCLSFDFYYTTVKYYDS